MDGPTGNEGPQFFSGEITDIKVTTSPTFGEIALSYNIRVLLDPKSPAPVLPADLSTLFRGADAPFEL